MKNFFMNVILSTQYLLSVPICAKHYGVSPTSLYSYPPLHFFSCTFVNNVFLKGALKFSPQPTSNLLWLLGLSVSVLAFWAYPMSFSPIYPQFHLFRWPL